MGQLVIPEFRMLVVFLDPPVRTTYVRLPVAQTTPPTPYLYRPKGAPEKTGSEYPFCVETV